MTCSRCGLPPESLLVPRTFSNPAGISGVFCCACVLDVYAARIIAFKDDPTTAERLVKDATDICNGLLSDISAMSDSSVGASARSKLLGALGRLLRR